MTETTDELWTPAELANYLGRTEAALAQLRYRGTGPSFTTAGGRIRYRRKAVTTWLGQHEKERTS